MRKNGDLTVDKSWLKRRIIKSAFKNIKYQNYLETSKLSYMNLRHIFSSKSSIPFKTCYASKIMSFARPQITCSYGRPHHLAFLKGTVL
jgi:hypothetical protein